MTSDTTREDPPAEAPDDAVSAPEEVSGRKRIGYLLRHSKLWLVALILLAVAAAVTAGSLAVFSSSSANPNNSVSAGILSQSNSNDNAAILTVTNLVPGQSEDGTVTIENTGDVKGTFSMTASNIVDTPGANGGKLSTALQLVIKDDTTGAEVYNGKFDAVGTVSLPGTGGPDWADGESHDFTFTVTLPDTGQPASGSTEDNAFQGSKVTVTYTWNAVST